MHYPLYFFRSRSRSASVGAKDEDMKPEEASCDLSNITVREKRGSKAERERRIALATRIVVSYAKSSRRSDVNGCGSSETGPLSSTLVRIRLFFFLLGGERTL